MPLYWLGNASLDALFEKLTDINEGKIEVLMFLEGKTDLKMIKSLCQKLNLDQKVKPITAITSCKGKDTIPSYISHILRILKVTGSPNLQKLVVIIDADAQEYEESVNSFINKIIKEIENNSFKHLKISQENNLLDEAIYQREIEYSTGKKLSLVICVMGLKQLTKDGSHIDVRKRIIEDHVVQGLLEEDKLKFEEIEKFYTSNLSSKDVLECHFYLKTNEIPNIKEKLKEGKRNRIGEILINNLLGENTLNNVFNRIIKLFSKL